MGSPNPLCSCIGVCHHEGPPTPERSPREGNGRDTPRDTRLAEAEKQVAQLQAELERAERKALKAAERHAWAVHKALREAGSRDMALGAGRVAEQLLEIRSGLREEGDVT